MLKNLPDCIPAGLVKDLRQALHSPVYLILYGIAMMLIGILYLDTGSFSATAFQIPLFLLLIPLRASMTVASDTHPRGNNFMQLTALSSRAIVWGIMLSSLLQILFTAAIIALIIGLLSLAPHGNHNIVRLWECLGGCVIGGALMTGFLMIASRVNLVFRLGAAAILAIMLVNACSTILREDSWWAWPLLLINAVLSLLVLVEFARRGYASPSENTTLAPRLLALTPLALYAILQLAGVGQNAATTQLLYGCWIACIAATLDIALPVVLPPRQKGSNIRWLPRVIQAPGVPQAALFLYLVAALVAAGLFWGGRELFPMTDFSVFDQMCEDRTCQEAFPEDLIHRWQLLVSMGLPIKWLFSVLLTVVILDGVSKRSHPNRLLYFAIVAFALLILGIVFDSHTSITSMWPYSSLIRVPSAFPTRELFQENLDTLFLTNLTALLVSILLLIVVLRKH